MNVKNILLMFMIIAAVLAGALLTGFDSNHPDNSPAVQVTEETEETKACPANCTMSCCAEKDGKSKCETDCSKPCCAAKKDAGKCPSDCDKPCCAEKNPPPVEDEVPLCCG